MDGIENNGFSNNIKAYPNPSSGQLNIDLSDFFDHVSVKIISSTGSLVNSYKFDSVSQIQIDIEGKAGIYFVEVNSNGKEHAVIKVIKR